ncbi:MAG: hypothetical protein FWC11_02235 [Firmicutes bacterium]|nr:hypothetical protein [Bacillota bacterium]MCL2255657.1 hypothetical protein [Bacillota bacterium]
MKKLKLLLSVIALVAIMVISVVMLTACPDNGPYVPWPTYHTVTWTSPDSLAITATIGESTTYTTSRTFQVREGESVEFAFPAPPTGHYLRIVSGGESLTRTSAGTWVLENITSNRTVAFSVALIPIEHFVIVGNFVNVTPRGTQREGIRITFTLNLPLNRTFTSFALEGITEQDLTSIGRTWSFLMPANNVTITANFMITDLCVEYGHVFGPNPQCLVDHCGICNRAYKCGGTQDCRTLNLYHNLRENGIAAAIDWGYANEDPIIFIPYGVGQYYQFVFGQQIGIQPESRESRNTYIGVFETNAQAEDASQADDFVFENYLIVGGNAFFRWYLETLITIGAPGLVIDINNHYVVFQHITYELMAFIDVVSMMGFVAERVVLHDVVAASLALGQYIGGADTANFDMFAVSCPLWAEAIADAPSSVPFFGLNGSATFTHSFGRVVFGGHDHILNFVRRAIEGICQYYYPDECYCLGHLVLISRGAMEQVGIASFIPSTPAGAFFGWGDDRFVTGTVVTIDFVVSPGFIVEIIIDGDLQTFRVGTHQITHVVGERTVIIMVDSFSNMEYILHRFSVMYGWGGEHGFDSFAGETTYSMTVWNFEIGQIATIQEVSTNALALRVKPTIVTNLGIMNQTNQYVAVYRNLIMWGTLETLNFIFDIVEATLHEIHITPVVFVEMQISEYMQPWVEYIIENHGAINVVYAHEEFLFLLTDYGPRDSENSWVYYVQEALLAGINYQNFWFIRVSSREIRDELLMFFAVDATFWSQGQQWSMYFGYSDCDYILFFGGCPISVNGIGARFGPDDTGGVFVIRVENAMREEVVLEMYRRVRSYVEPRQGINLNTFLPFMFTRDHNRGWPGLMEHFVEGFTFYRGIGTAANNIHVFLLDCYEFAERFAQFQRNFGWNVGLCCSLTCCGRLIVFAGGIDTLDFIFEECACFLNCPTHENSNAVCDCVCIHFQAFFGFREFQFFFNSNGVWELDTISSINGDAQSFRDRNISIYIFNGLVIWYENGIPVKEALVDEGLLCPLLFGTNRIFPNWYYYGSTNRVNIRTELSIRADEALSIVINYHLWEAGLEIAMLFWQYGRDVEGERCNCHLGNCCYGIDCCLGECDDIACRCGDDGCRDCVVNCAGCHETCCESSIRPGCGFCACPPPGGAGCWCCGGDFCTCNEAWCGMGNCCAGYDYGAGGLLNDANIVANVPNGVTLIIADMQNYSIVFDGVVLAGTRALDIQITVPAGHTLISVVINGITFTRRDPGDWGPPGATFQNFGGVYVLEFWLDANITEVDITVTIAPIGQGTAHSCC